MTNTKINKLLCDKVKLLKWLSKYTVNAGELGPLGKLGPDNTWLNEIRFFLLNYNTSTAYQNHIDFSKAK